MSSAKFVAAKMAEDIRSKIVRWHEDAMLYGVGFLLLESNGAIKNISSEEVSKLSKQVSDSKYVKNLTAQDEEDK